MYKSIFIILILILASCKTNKIVSKSKLFEVLYQSEIGGESYNFYEIINDEKGFRKVLSEEVLLNKVKKDDIKTSTFLYLSLGEKSTGGFGISVENIEEFSDKIVVKLKKTAPKPNELVTTAFTYPFCVVKINSKKEIEIID